MGKGQKWARNRLSDTEIGVRSGRLKLSERIHTHTHTYIHKRAVKQKD